VQLNFGDVYKTQQNKNYQDKVVSVVFTGTQRDV